MLGLIRGFLGGVIAAATMCGGLRAIARGDKLPTEGLVSMARKLAMSFVVRTAPGMVGAKGGSAGSCPPQGAAHHLAKCPSCGRRWHEHESA